MLGVMNNEEFSAEEILDFQTECGDLLEESEKALLALRSGNEFLKHFDLAFRTLHSVKGASGMMKEIETQACVHELETILTQYKNAGKVPETVLDFLLKGCDRAKALVALAGKPKNLLPKSEKKEETPEKVSEQTNQKIRVLVLDDEPELVETLREVLESAGFQVDAYTRPQDAIRAILKKAPDIFLSDYRMPEMNGSEVLDAIRKDYPELPVIFVSAYFDTTLLLRALREGLFSAIEKPVNFEDLIRLCSSARQKTLLQKGFNKSVQLILHHFSDLELTLENQPESRQSLRSDVLSLVEFKKELRTEGKLRVRK